MNKSWLGCGFTLSLVITGCAPQQAATPITNVNPIAQNVDQKTPATDGSAGSANALAAKSKTWTDQIGEMLAKRMAQTRPITDPEATFIKPDATNADPNQQATARNTKPDVIPQVVPISHPKIESTNSHANAGASLTVETTSPVVLRPAEGSNKVFGDSVGSKGSVRVANTGSLTSELEAVMNRKMTENPKDLWANMDFQMMQFLKDKNVPQMDVMSKLNTEDRELLTAVMDGLTNFRNAIRADGNMLTARKVKPILEMADRLRKMADLSIPQVSLCSRVDGFGVYEPIDPARFVAMREHPIIIYCEVENFSSNLNDKRLWETRLSQEVVLYTETGLPIWQDKIDNVIDNARRRRHDFFVVKKTRLPGNIAIGRYLMKVTIVDQNASRVAEATIPVQFVAQ